MQRQQLEVAEVAEPRAEIVKRDPHALRGQCPQHCGGLSGIAQQHLLGHFQRQPPRRKARLRQQLRKLACIVSAGEIVRGDVERQPQIERPARAGGQRQPRDVLR